MTMPCEQEWTTEHDYAVLCADRKVRARVSTDELTPEEAKATARLCSAAPDMARELRHLVRLLEPLENEGGLNVPGLATLNGARRALRKAGVIP